MSKPKLTPWFSGDVQPAHEGVYLRKWPFGSFYAKWDGLWRYGYTNECAAEHMSTMSPEQCLPWRGLAHKPKARKA